MRRALDRNPNATNDVDIVMGTVDAVSLISTVLTTIAKLADFATQARAAAEKDRQKAADAVRALPPPPKG